MHNSIYIEIGLCNAKFYQMLKLACLQHGNLSSLCDLYAFPDIQNYVFLVLKE